MPDTEEAVLVTETGAGLFQVRIETGESSFLADEPVAVGGLSTGPDPFDLACAALGACTVMTMRLYARHKGWDVPRLSASVRHFKAARGSRDRFERSIHLDPALSSDQQARLLAIADRCPVHRMLELGSEIATRVAAPDLPAPEAGTSHGRIIEELCGSPDPEPEERA
jgi:putative redox protein